MHKFEITSPGKIILHGEHAVVYRKPALAAVVGLSTRLQFRRQPGPLASVHMDALNCSIDIKLEQFNDFLVKFRNKHPGCDMFASTAQLLEEVRHLDGVVVTTSPQQQHSQKAFVSLYFLLAGAALSSPDKDFILKDGFRIDIDSDLNIGSGLGSSASFGAALATAFLVYAGHFDETSYLEPQNQSLISQWAFESERIMHGTPSGVDNTVCTYGGMVRFVKGQGFEQLKTQHPLNILLVDSRVNRSTADVVANVRHLWETLPRVVDSIWNACEELVNEAIPLYESFGNGQDDSEKFEKLERLFQMNNDLMKAVGVSHPKLEQIFTIAFKRGFFSKLTGAGAGGYAIVLLPENYHANEVYNKLKEELVAAGFGVHETTAGGVGLRIEKIVD